MSTISLGNKLPVKSYNCYDNFTFKQNLNKITNFCIIAFTILSIANLPTARGDVSEEFTKCMEKCMEFGASPQGCIVFCGAFSAVRVAALGWA